MVIALTEVQPYSNGEYLLQKYAASHHGSTVLELLQSLDSLQILYTIGLRRNKTFDSYIHNILRFFLLPCFSFYLIFVCLMFILHLVFCFISLIFLVVCHICLLVASCGGAPYPSLSGGFPMTLIFYVWCVSGCLLWIECSV